jgi:rhomboid protease GluP
MGLPYWLIPHDGHFWLFVNTESREAIQEQLERFEREQRRLRPWDRHAEKSLEFTPVPMLPLQWLLWLVWLIPIHAIHHLGFADLIGRGALDTVIIRADGAWWRIVTALTLHADMAHLMGNLVFGLWFLSVLLRCYGVGWGWLLVVLGGAGGNLLNVLFHGELAHRAIGASTAVFAMLGLLAAYGFRSQSLQSRGSRPWYHRWAPIGMAVGLLGWWGTAGAQTDIMGHLFGFSAGLALGHIAVGRLPLERERINQGAGAFAFAIPVVCWWLAR